jgi:hypothetical protein
VFIENSSVSSGKEFGACLIVQHSGAHSIEEAVYGFADVLITIRHIEREPARYLNRGPHEEWLPVVAMAMPLSTWVVRVNLKGWMMSGDA